MNKHLKEIFTINLLYMLLAALLLTIGVMVQQKNLIIGLLFTEWIIIFLPTLAFVKVKKIRLVDLRIQPLSFKDSILTIWTTIFFYPIVIFINLTFNYLLNLFIKYDPVQIPLPNSFEEYLIYLPVVVLSAAICEEFFFRGLMLWSYRGIGREKAIVFSSVLFGIFHFNYQNFIGPILLGIIFGYLVYKTGSIFAGIIGHMTHNFISITLGYMAMNHLSQLEQNIQSTNQEANLISAMISWGIMALLSVQVVKWLIKRIGKDQFENKVESMRVGETGTIPWIPVYIVTISYLIIIILSFNI